jgi:hypothetical protein
MQALIDLYSSLMTKNWFAVAAIVLMIAIQILKTVPWLQQKIWARLPVGYRFLVPVVGAMAAAFVHGYFAHETLATDLWDVAKIALGAMGGNAALTESPLPWSGGSGGAPAPTPPSTPLASVPRIPPLIDAQNEADDDKTPIDGHGSKPPPPAA